MNSIVHILSNIEIYKYQEDIYKISNIISFWGIIASQVDMILQSLWNISRYPWERACANKEATEPRFPLSSDEVSLRKINGRHHDLHIELKIE
jgi:hypothetical protein